ncbi:hypothetical protein GGR54DRAFT_454610 [Hypoxylon sp. NC1633]|nr:hypothetical protein GGR54DRAFT_454610 [Hypoxylon sp. NC1633]
MDKPKSAATAKWGAACSPCALAKAKCLRSSDLPGSRCERCERLEKDCVGQVHKPRKKRQVRPSKTAQLEERLNSLVDYIKATNSGDIPASLNHSPEDRLSAPLAGEITDGSTAPSLGKERGDTPTTAAGSDHIPSNTVPSSYNERAPDVCVCRAPAGDVPMPLESDATSLSIFIDKLLPCYPFVTFPPGCTAPELASKHPLLFSTIRMVSSYRNLRSMRSQNYFIMRHISEHLLMRSERSLEILQSILVVLSSYHYHCMIHAQMNNLIALANSLVADLGINKAAELQERTKLLAAAPDQPRARTNDERRALCGVWYMTSMISLAFQRIDPPKYTPYIDQCLRELDVAKEYETDSLLVHLVRIQHLSERISQLHSKDQIQNELVGITRAPLSAYEGMFHTELENFKASLPLNIASNKLIMCHINTAMLRLWEPPRIDAALLEKISKSLASLSLDSASSLDIFYRSSAALKSWFDDWLSIDVADYFVLPMPASAQLINAVIMLARWSKLSSPSPNFTPAPPSASTQIVRSDPGCSGMASVPAVASREIDPAIPAALRAIRSHLISQPELQIDVLGIIQAMATRFEQAREEGERQSGAGWENDIWDMAARKIKGTRLKLERWAELVAAAGSESRKPEASSADSNVTGEPYLDGQGMEGNWPVESSGIDTCVQPSNDGWDPGASWANDFFDGLGLDQNFFFDGSGDYGAVVLNSLRHP